MNLKRFLNQKIEDLCSPPAPAHGLYLKKSEILIYLKPYFFIEFNEIEIREIKFIKKT